MIDYDEDMVWRHGKLINHVARRAISGVAARPLDELPPVFNRTGACFVTLLKAGNLRGCCGSVLARRPLIEDISANALRAAFGDPRFTPLERVEWEEISLSVTLLSSLRPMSFASEAELLSKLQPLQDGLLIEDAGRCAVFLPAVWEMLPNKHEFLAHLKAKAGMSANHWSSNFRASCFSVKRTSEEELHLSSFGGEFKVA